MPDHERHAPPVGVLIAQLGTPDAPTAAALRPYLRDFLSDPRVIDLHPLKWLPILYLFILPRRPRRSAALYRNVWTPAGSPLLVHSQAQVAGLQELLGDAFQVALGMRYGQPNIETAMAGFAAAGVERVLVFPMFPQFSCSTTGSLYDGVVRAANGRRCPLFFDRRRRMPTLRFVPPYFDDDLYIRALRSSLEDHAAANGGTPDRYLFTFHGLPRRYAEEGDPYREQCESTARLLAASMGLEESDWVLSFQSRFGREEWLQPYTDELLEEMGRQGLARITAACPGFTADCLETIDEIGREGAQQFQAAGGGQLNLAPCLNDHPAWLESMAQIVRREAAGWVS